MTTPRRYSRNDAVHLISTTLAPCQGIELERDSLRYRYPETNFGFSVGPEHEATEAQKCVDHAYNTLMAKLRELGTVKTERHIGEIFEAENCNYYLVIRKGEDWRGNPTPIFSIGIFKAHNRD